MKRFRHLNILPPTLLLAITALLSRVLGVVRDHLLAKAFGATEGVGIYNLDTYYAAFRIPDLLYNLLIFGAVSAAFIPIFTKYKKEREMNEAWKFASSMLHLMMIIILVVAGVSYIFAPQLTHLVASGFSDEAFAQTVQLMRIMLISPIIFTLTSVLVSIQDSFKSFLFRSIGPLFYNGGIILGIIYFGQQFGVVGVTWGVIIGALLQLIVQLPALRQMHYKHFWILGFKRKDVRKSFRMVIPRVLSLSMMQLIMLVNTYIASFLITGSITILYLAENLYTLPFGMIAISFGITSFATLSELAMEKTTAPFAIEIKRVMHQILFLIIPAMFGMFLLRGEIIDLILVSGKFTSEDALLTGQVLGILLLSLFAHSLLPLLTRGFFAYHNTKLPLIATFSGAILTITLSVTLALKLNYGVSGIAVAVAAGNILSFIIHFLMLTSYLKQSILDWGNVLKMLVSGAAMTLCVLMAKNVIPYGDNVMQKFGVLISITLIGALAYFGMAALLKIPERKMVTRKLR